MNGNKQVGFGVVGHGGTLFERNEGVVFPRVNDFRAGKFLFDKMAQAKRDVQAKIFLHQAVRPDGSGIVSAMARIDDDAADFQAERAGERMLSITRGLGLGRRLQGSAARSSGLRFQRCTFRSRGGGKFRREFGGCRIFFAVGGNCFIRLLRGVRLGCRGVIFRGRERGCRGIRSGRNRRAGSVFRGGNGGLAVYFNHQAIGVGEKVSRIVARAIDIQNQANYPLAVLSDTDRFQQAVLHIDCFLSQPGAEVRFV